MRMETEQYNIYQYYVDNLLKFSRLKRWYLNTIYCRSYEWKLIRKAAETNDYLRKKRELKEQKK